MSTHKKLLLFIATLFALIQAKSQGVGVGVETPNPNAVLELVSPGNNQGLLVPKLTTAQRTATSFTNNLTSNENGLLVYDTDENAFYFWINSQWMSMQTAVNVTAGEGIQIIDGEISNTGDLDDSNELQDISLSGNQLSISEGSSIDLSSIDTDTQLSESEVDAFVSNNGFIETESDPSVPANLKDGVDWNEVANIPTDLTDGDDNTQLTEAEVDAFVNNNGFLVVADLSNYDSDASDDFSGDFNDLINVPADVADGDDNTQLTEAEVDAFTSNNGYLVAADIAGYDNDASDDFDGEFSSLSNVPAGLADGDDDTQLDEAAVDAFVANNGYLTAEVDGSITNEIQDLELAGNTLRITNNASATDIDLAPFMGTNTDEQTLSLVGTDLSISGGNTIDISSIDTDTQLSDGDIAGFGYIKVDTDTDDQTLSFDGTNLSIVDGNSVNISSLSDGIGTDDQQLTLSSNNLSIESGNSVSLLPYLDNTDAQSLSIGGGNLNISGGTGVSLASIQDGTGTDDQTLSFDGTSISIEDGNSVNISAIDTDTDDQTLAFDGTNLSIADGNSIDISSLSDGTGTDDQTISFDGTNISIEDGNSVDISAIDTDTDDQTLAFDGTNISIADGNSVDISSLADGTGTDDQTASEVDVTDAGGNFTNTDVEGVLEEIDTRIDALVLAGGSDGNDYVTGGSLSGTDLTLNVPNQIDPVIDLSGLQDGSGTDDQNLSLVGSTLNIEDGTGVNLDGTFATDIELAALDTDDADADPGNEIQNLSVGGGNLNISGGTGVSLSSLQDGIGTDDQQISFSAGNINLTGTNPSSIDVSSWDLNASDDFSGSWNNLTDIPADIADGDDDTQLTDDDISAFGYIKTDSDNQNLSVSGGNLNISGGTGVSLASLQDGTGTDDQNLSLVGTTLNIEDGTGVNLNDTFATDAELAALDTDDADADPGNELQNLSVGGGNLNISGGTGVSLSSLQDGTGTDDQQISFSAGNINLTGTNPSSINVSGWDLNASDDITSSGFSGNVNVSDGSGGLNSSSWEISGDDLISTNSGSLGNSGVPVTNIYVDRLRNDFASLDIISSDDITINGGSSSIIVSNSGVTVDGSNVSNWDQNASDDFSGSWNDLTDIPTDIADGDDNTQLTDDDISAFGYIKTDADNQSLSVSGGNLNISGGTGVNLSLIQDGTGSDDQRLALSSNTLSIEDGNNVDLAPYLDNTDAQTLSFDGADLSITGGNSVDLSALDELPSQSGQSGNFLTTNGTNASWATVPSSPWNINGNDVNYTTGSVGVGTTTMFNEMVVSGTNNTVSTDDGIMLDVQNISGTIGTLTGIRFKKNGVTSNQRYNSAIFYDGVDLMFATKTNSSSTNVSTADAALTINDDGKVGVGTTNIDADKTLHISNTAIGANGAIVEIEGPLNNASGATLRLTESSGTDAGFDLHYNASTNDLKFRSIVSDAVSVDNILVMERTSGNVGIRTESPSAELDIVGDLELNGDFIKSGRTINSFSNTASINGAGQNLTPPSNGAFVRISTLATDGLSSISTITAGQDGQELLIINTDPDGIGDNGGQRTATRIRINATIFQSGDNNIFMPQGQISLYAGGVAKFIYIDSLNGWLLISHSTNGTGILN